MDYVVASSQGARTSGALHATGPRAPRVAPDPASHVSAHLALEEATRERLAAHERIVDRFRAQLHGGGMVSDDDLRAFARGVANEARSTRRYVERVQALLVTDGRG